MTRATSSHARLPAWLFNYWKCAQSAARSLCVSVCAGSVCEQPISASAANRDKAIMCCMLQVLRHLVACHCLVTTQWGRERWRVDCSHSPSPLEVQGIECNPCNVALALALVMAARVEQIKVPPLSSVKCAPRIMPQRANWLVYVVCCLLRYSIELVVPSKSSPNPLAYHSPSLSLCLDFQMLSIYKSND